MMRGTPRVGGGGVVCPIGSTDCRSGRINVESDRTRTVCGKRGMMMIGPTALWVGSAGC